ncbi:hypothetical protein Q1695_003830 [Nippostrongylus brasiliensis]|nr:hypothetical protein Q1695_003830 [Nippostrongylus brasiliensis]
MLDFFIGVHGLLHRNGTIAAVSSSTSTASYRRTIDSDIVGSFYIFVSREYSSGRVRLTRLFRKATETGDENATRCPPCGQTQRSDRKIEWSEEHPEMFEERDSGNGESHQRSNRGEYEAT